MFLKSRKPRLRKTKTKENQSSNFVDISGEISSKYSVLEDCQVIVLELMSPVFIVTIQV